MTIFSELLDTAVAAREPLTPRTESEGDQVYLGRLTRAVATATGEQFNAMSTPAQEWFDVAAAAFNRVKVIPEPDGFHAPLPIKLSRPKLAVAPADEPPPSALPDPIVLPPEPPHPTPTPDPLPEPQAPPPVAPVEPAPSVLPDPPPLPPEPPYTEPVAAEQDPPPPLAAKAAIKMAKEAARAAVKVAKKAEAVAKKAEAAAKPKRTRKAKAAAPEPEPVPVEPEPEPEPEPPPPAPEPEPVAASGKRRRQVMADDGLTVSQRVRQYVIEDQTITINGIVERLKKEHLDHATKRSTISTLRYDTVCTLQLVQQAGWGPQP